MIKAKIIFILTFVGILSSGFASEIMISPDQMEDHSFQIGLYGVKNERKPSVELTHSGSFQLEGANGSLSVFGNSEAEVKMDSKAQSTVALINFRPRNGFSYRVKLGQIQSYDLESDSGTFVNNLSATKSGFIWGAGIRWNLTQATMVSSAINFDLGYTAEQIKLDRFESNGNVESAEINLRHEEYQGAFSASRRFRNFEPYAGFKIFRLYTDLVDSQTKEKIKGHTDGVAPFIGLKFEPFSHEYFVIEGSFIDEKSVSAGITIQF